MADTTDLNQKQEWQEPASGEREEKTIQHETLDIKSVPAESEASEPEDKEGGLRPSSIMTAHSAFVPPSSQPEEQQKKQQQEKEEEQTQEQIQEQAQEQQEQEQNLPKDKDETIKILQTAMDLLLMAALLPRKKSSLENKQDWQQGTHANSLNKGFSLDIPGLDEKLRKVLNDPNTMVPKPLKDMLEKVGSLLKQQQDPQQKEKLANPLQELAKMAKNFEDSLKPKSKKDGSANPLVEVFRTIAALGTGEKKNHEQDKKESFDLIGRFVNVLKNIAGGKKGQDEQSEKKDPTDELTQVFSGANKKPGTQKAFSLLLNLLPGEVQGAATDMLQKTPSPQPGQQGQVAPKAEDVASFVQQLSSLLNPNRQEEIERKLEAQATSPHHKPVPG